MLVNDNNKYELVIDGGTPCGFRTLEAALTEGRKTTLPLRITRKSDGVLMAFRGRAEDPRTHYPDRPKVFRERSAIIQ